MSEIKTGLSKWLALPIVVKLAKHALDIILILGLAAMAVAGTQEMNSALDEMNPLIESGVLPECVKNLPMGICMVLLSGIMLLIYLRKR